MRKSCLGLIPDAVLSAVLGVHTYAASGDAYTWPGYRSDLDYDTKSNLGESSITIVRALPERRPVNGGRFIGARIATAALPT